MHYHVPKPFFRKSRKTWYVQIDGRQINLGKDRTEAFQRYYEVMANPPEDRLEKATVSDGMPLIQLFDRFLDWVKSHRSDATYAWYQYRLQRFSDCYPDLTVEALRPFHVQEWVDGYPEHSQTTTRNYMRTVKRCLKWAKRLGHIKEDPIEFLEVPSGEARDVYLNEAAFADFIQHTSDQNLLDLLVVTYECGCRPQESLRLEIRHLDLERARWVFPKSEAKGKKKPRIVYLSEKALEITRRLAGDRTSGFVFRNANGLQWKPSAVNCALQRMRVRMGQKEMKRLGIEVKEADIKKQIAKLSPTRKSHGKEIAKTLADLRYEAKWKLRRTMAYEYAPKYSLYSLRHSWATNALLAGVDSLTVAILMGHQDPSTLAKVYQHLGHDPEHMLKEAKKAAGESGSRPE